MPGSEPLQSAEREMSRALAWIAGLLRARDVPFQVVGGLAARAWGARRPLADLDLYVSARCWRVIEASLSPHRVSGPRRHRDEHWDLTFVSLRRHGIQIEIGFDDEARYREAHTGAWRDQRIDYSASVQRTVLGHTVPVMPLAQLIDYKRRLDREVDRQDIAELER